MYDLRYSFKIDITKDKQEAYLTIVKDLDGEILTEVNILNTLKKYNISFGIIYENIEKICKEHSLNNKILIAQGIKPIDGQDEKIELNIDFNNISTLKILKNECVDYKDLQLYKNVKKGDLLAKKLDSVPGKDGINIFGEIVKCKEGKKVDLPAGKNTYIENNLLLSSIDGHVIKKNGKLEVNEVIEVKDIDAFVGNIKTNASLIISGNIRSAFSVGSEGDIEIFGVVEGATVNAKGNIIIHKGIQGNGKAKLISGGDIVSKYIQNCDISADGDITSEAIIYSNVRCNGSINMIGKKGLIVGSTVVAAKSINAKNVGSKTSTRTELQVGVSPEKRLRIKEISDKINVNTKNINDLKKIIDYFEKLGISDNKIEIYKKVKIFVEQLVEENQILLDELNELNMITKKEGYGIIKVSENIYPGSKIIIDEITLQINDTYEYTMFIKDGSNIKILPYK
ncbi:MAG: FapA family protein [Thermoanaerobacteraceae bacterium]|nr:FapA family protein [Thermoanaerobacteraceae bacterium]